MNLIPKNFLTISKNVIKVIRHNATKVLKHQEGVIIQKPETLTGRILHYLNIDNVNANINSANNHNVSTLRDKFAALDKLNTKEIVNLLNSISLQNQGVNKTERSTLIRKLNTESCLRLSELDVGSILELLNTFMNLLPNNEIIRYKFYELAVKELFKSLQTLSKDQVLKLIFYISLQKRNTNAQFMLRECIKIMDETFIESLTVEELCIICNSMFKASTKITNNMFLNKVKKSIDDNLIIFKDPALFITLIKIIRHNRVQDDNLLSTISCCIFFNKTLDYYSFSALCHILALYADYLYYDKNILEIFTKKCLELLRDSSFTNKSAYLLEQPRGKDIKRLLWVLSIFSEFNLINENEIDSIIIPKLIERIEKGEFDNDVDSLIDILLHLWTLNYRPKKLVPYVLVPEKINNLDTKTKSKLRLNLLLYCIYVEDRKLYNSLNVRPKKSGYNISFEFQAKQRPLLGKILSELINVSDQLDVDGFEITQEVQFLNIFGITGYKRGTKVKAVFIEILDDYTCVKNTFENFEENIPGGMLALKLRLLAARDQGVLLVSQSEVEAMTESEIREYLLDEIKMIC